MVVKPDHLCGSLTVSSFALATSVFPDPGLWKRLCGIGFRGRGL